MKKLFAIVLSAAALLMGTQAYAQLSVGAGWLNSTESTTFTSGSSSNTNNANLNGFYAGGQYNINIVAGLGVAPGLYVSALFGKQTGSQGIVVGTVSGEAKYSEVALNVPVNVNYKFAIGRDFNVFVYAGPIFQYGLVSTTKVSASVSILGASGSGEASVNNYTGVVKDSDGNSTSGDPNRNPFNIYLGGGAGIQAGNFQVILGYDHSLTNVSKVTDDTIGRSQIKLGVGYAF